VGTRPDWLASLFYLWILHRDPLTEIFGSLFTAR